MWVRVVVFQLEVFKFEVKNIFHIGVNHHAGQGAWFATELQTCLLQVILIQVGVACGVHEFSWFQTADLCHHHEQQSVTCNIKWHAQEGICRALVELQ